MFSVSLNIDPEKLKELARKRKTKRKPTTKDIKAGKSDRTKGGET